jgi:RNA polymerase sigma-70 factor (ECF subfamily)
MNTSAASGSPLKSGWFGQPAEVVKAFGSRIFSLAKHITQDDAAAEDILIETFLEICADAHESLPNNECWLRLVTVAVRKAFSKQHNRGEGADPSEEFVIRELFVWGDDYQQRVSQGETPAILQDGLRGLDPMARTVFVLRDIEGISIENIATIVNRSVPAVEVCLLRARLQLRESLAPQMKPQVNAMDWGSFFPE